MSVASSRPRSARRREPASDRIVAMLTKLVVGFDPDQYRVRESASGLAAPFEDEDDDEHEDEFKIHAQRTPI